MTNNPSNDDKQDKLPAASRRILRLADQIEAKELMWSPAFASRPDQVKAQQLPFHTIIDDIHDWLSQEEVFRYATEPAGSDYFRRAWKDPEEFNNTREYFAKMSHNGLAHDVMIDLHFPDPISRAKNRVAQAEHYLENFQRALQYQYECAQAVRAYVQTITKEHDGEIVVLDRYRAEKFEEALDLHLIDIGKYDPMLKHHIHASCHDAASPEGSTINEMVKAEFDSKNVDEYFERVEHHLRNNLDALTHMNSGLRRYRERIDEISREDSQKQK